MLAKLDEYDYKLIDSFWPEELIVYIRVKSKSDPTIADLSTEINQADNHIFVEGYYLYLKDFCVININGIVKIKLTLVPDKKKECSVND